jgi:putative glycerol-1-phosphate prenyltransferase
MVYDLIKSAYLNSEKLLTFLIDPDKCSDSKFDFLIQTFEKRPPHFILVGGSLISMPFESIVKRLKQNLDIPIVLFPGHPSHIYPEFDALLFLSMISGRNPELLIGSQVVAAPIIKRYAIETISTGYMLIDGGVLTSVEYMSNTRPIPADKTDIIISTAIAGEMLGHKLIYMDAGSGAINPVPGKVIENVKLNCSIPIMIGGGINTPEKLNAAFNFGADIVVIGNVLEKSPEMVEDFLDVAELY